VKSQFAQNIRRYSGAPRPRRASDYQLFDGIDGRHSFKDAVPSGYVDYQVRTRQGGQVTFFNFRLAKEMGLIPASHPEQMNEKLSQKILETFALVIINEYDIEHGIQYPSEEIRPNRYMATRYLQLQHPDKRGRTSGDGRGIWNGEFRGRNGVTWDISSSGTGATCLSPAAAQTGKFFKTGDRFVGYGNGYNTIDEGLSAALMSEIFHRNGIPTERTLAIISFEGMSSINVRAAHNLLRPSHFFCHLKQGNHAGLKSAIDYFIRRQCENGHWPKNLLKQSAEIRYAELARRMASTFAESAALFESHYIFCWLDWDGDNILSTGGIIDYGSVRQFGLYHRDYRYDDVDRFSTSIPEQKFKARYIAQTFAQIRDFLITGKKKNIRLFARDPALKVFDTEFDRVMDETLLVRTGIGAEHRRYLMKEHSKLVRRFRSHFSYFERVCSKRGFYEIPDGKTRDAIFCVRALLREYPRRYLERNGFITAEEFIELMKSGYAKPDDLVISEYRLRRIEEFQDAYFKLVQAVGARFFKQKTERALLEVVMRSSLLNRGDRITGDGAIKVTYAMIRHRKKLSIDRFHEVFEAIVRHQTLLEPDGKEVSKCPKVQKLIRRNLRVIHLNREGL
jgi:uncharacterized protein YdiU (UPF0061 family)